MPSAKREVVECRWTKTPEIISRIQELMRHETAGDPMSGLKWTRKTTAKIAEALNRFEVRVSPKTVSRLLKAMDYSLRVNHKKRSFGSSPDRDEQFRYLNHLRGWFTGRGEPVISVDTKKRELIGES